MKIDQVLHKGPVAIPFYRMHVSFLSSWSVWVETKSIPALKWNALFCWKFSSCLWSSLLPHMGKQKKIPNGLVTFHTVILHLVIPHTISLSRLGGSSNSCSTLLLSRYCKSLSKGCKSKIQKSSYSWKEM